jgi:hypothetical protein
MLWILRRAARQSGLFSILPPPIPDRLSSLLAYESKILITSKGWYATRFDEPLVTGVDPDQPGIVAVSWQANPERSWVFREPDDRMPLVAGRYFVPTELVPGSPFASSGESEMVGLELAKFDDLGLLRG